MPAGRADRPPGGPVDPIRPTDDAARRLARGLIAAARFGALAVTDPEFGTPFVTRIGLGHEDGAPLLLVSDLALHTRALLADPACALLIGEPGGRGDPLTHPRLTLCGHVEPVDKAARRDVWLAAHPKARLYFDFADFRLLRLVTLRAHLNGGFGRAYRLSPGDLDPAEETPRAPLTGQGQRRK